jgi:hypothetical protein
MNEPLDYRGVTFYLWYVDYNYEKVQIAEPINFDGVNFVLKQGDKRYGRDVSFGGGDVSLLFSPKVEIEGLTHDFERLIELYKWRGYEADVKFIINIDGVEKVIGNLDFYDAKTDLITYFECKVIEDLKEAILRRNSSTTVDLSSDKKVYDNSDTSPLTPELILVKPTKRFVLSELKAGAYTFGTTNSFDNIFISIFQEQTRFDIDFTNVPDIGAISMSAPSAEDTYLIDAENNLTNVKVAVSDLHYVFTPGDWQATEIIWRVSDVYSSNPADYTRIAIPENDTGYNGTFNIGTITRGQKLWFSLMGTSQGSQFGVYTVQSFSGNINIEATSTSVASVVKAFRLYEVIGYLINSTTGGNLLPYIPDFFDGKFKNQYITNGLLMRLIEDNKLTITLDSLFKSLQEINYDYQLDGNAFKLLHYDSFYQDVEVGYFEISPSDEFTVKVNPRYAIKTFNYKYKNYEDSNDINQSLEGVHTELQLNLLNYSVENTKDIKIDWIRDAYLIDKMRSDAITKDEDTATTNDDKNVILDVVDMLDLETYSENFYLKHDKIDDTNLIISNDGSIYFDVLGFVEGDTITLGNENVGLWKVNELTKKTMKLEAQGGQTVTFTGYAVTSLIYTITATTKKTRLDEDFQEINNITAPTINLMFSMKRNIVTYWKKYLTTSVQFANDKTAQVTKYIHNRDFSSKLVNEPLIVEGADIELDVNDKILTPYIAETVVLCDFNTFWDIKTNIIQNFGYIRIKNTEGVEWKIYPTKLDFQWGDNKMTITGELKW